MDSLGIVGFGNMGEAMISGVMAKHPALKLFVVEKVPSRIQRAVKKYNAVNCTEKPQTLFTECQAVIIAIKPQDLQVFSQAIKAYSSQTPLISIAVGVNLERLRDLFLLPQIARFMPSMVAGVGKSVTSLSFSAECNRKFRNLAIGIAESIGLAIELPERLVPAIIGISGSAIAYVFEFIHALALGGVKNGIAYDSSLKIAMEVLEGGVQTLRSSGVAPGELIAKVCSPGGTTIEGISSLQNSGFTSAVIKAVDAAAQKAVSLED